MEGRVLLSSYTLRRHQLRMPHPAFPDDINRKFNPTEHSTEERNRSLDLR